MKVMNYFNKKIEIVKNKLSQFDKYIDLYLNGYEELGPKIITLREYLEKEIQDLDVDNHLGLILYKEFYDSLKKVI